jgi:hypothetical protein
MISLSTCIGSAMGDFIYKHDKKTISSSCHNGARANNLLGMKYYMAQHPNSRLFSSQWLATVWLPRIVDGDCLLTSPHQTQVTSHAPTAGGSGDDVLVFIETGGGNMREYLSSLFSILLGTRNDEWGGWMARIAKCHARENQASSAHASIFNWVMARVLE